MNRSALVIGAIVLLLGILAATGMLSYIDHDKVAKLGSVEIEAKHERKTPENWGYALIGAGVLILAAGAVAGRRS